MYPIKHRESARKELNLTLWTVLYIMYSLSVDAGAIHKALQGLQKEWKHQS